MSKEFEHTRLSPDALHKALWDLNLTGGDFAELTSTKRATVSRWFKETNDPEYLAPPFWVTQLLALAHLPGGLDRLRAVSALNIIWKNRYDQDPSKR